MTSLDGVRGVAALVVVAHHILGAMHRPYPGHLWIAVDLFFVLSGFVIAMSYERKLQGTMSLAEFGLIRLGRLYPMIFLGSFLGLIVTVAGLGLVGFTPILLLGFLVVPIFGVEGAIYPLNGVFWSILFELVANAAHGLLARVLSDRLLVALVVVAGLAACVAARAYGTLLMGWEAPGALSIEFLGALPRVAFGYFAGVLLYRTRGTWSSWMPQLPFPLVAILVVVALAVPYVRGGYRTGGVYDELVIVLVVLPAIIALASVATTTGLIDPAARFLGRISYPLYAIHAPLVLVAEAMRERSLGWVNGKVFWLSTAVAIVLVSWIVAVAIDEPWQRYRKSRRRAVRPVEPATA